MAPHTRKSLVEISEVDFDSDHGAASSRMQTTINRNVSKAPKRRGVTMKKSATAAPKSKAPREALKDRSNLQREEEEIVVAVPTKKNSRKALPKGDDENTEPAAKRAKITKAAVSQPRSAKAASTSKKRAPSPDALPVIPETQPIEDISESIEVNPESAIDEPEVEIQPVAEITASRARSISHQPQAQSYIAPSRARSTSQQPRSYSREGSAALAERRLAEADTRRRLSEITSKYEDMRLKYESLSELGTNAAATQFDKLKRATDQRAKDANELIATLKKELSEARKSTSSSTTDNAKLQTQLSTAEASQEQARTELKDAQASLLEAQNEVKALTAKLEAARDAARKAASVAAADKTPGSAIKTRGTLGGSNLDSAKQAALKEELYRDLTGLIINSVKRKEGEDEYSCIQTGRNGTLHFHLSINNDATQINPKTPSGLGYEDAEFAYEPFFDAGRDRDLIDILPDYLTEEICFPRSHAVKFYTKVVDSMTKKVVIDEDE